MAAIATKKRLGDQGVQLTFPAVFQKAFKGGYSYYPTGNENPLPILVGTDFQSHYHEQKRIEANASVMNGLAARRSMERKLLTGPHNYHLPKPVLGQRRFANPSYGAAMYSSARQDQNGPWRLVEAGLEGAGMVGGVLKTAEGQQFYRRQLDDRIRQLDRLNALASGFAVPTGEDVATYDNRKVGEPDKIQFFLYLQGLGDAVLEGDITRFTFENLKDWLKLLFQFAPTASPEDFQQMIEGVDSILEDLRPGIEDELYGNPEYATTVEDLVSKARQYITQMAASTLQPRDKLTLSKSLIQSLGFGRIIRARTPRQALLDADSERTQQAVDDFDADWDEDDDDDDDGYFYGPAQPREDEEAGGMPRAPFAGRGGDPNRDRWGAREGAFGVPQWFGEGAAGFEGAVEAADVGPGMAAPLDLAGYDPEAQPAGAPAADTGAIKDALVDTVERHLKDLDDAAGTAEKSYKAVFDANYEGRGDLFVSRIAEAMTEQGFNPAQIAEAMRLADRELGLDGVFDEWIAENAGDLAPAAAAPARRRVPTLPSLPSGGLGDAGAASILADMAAGAPEGLRLRVPAGAAPAAGTPGAQSGWPAGVPTERSALYGISMKEIKRIGSLLTPPYRPKSTTQLKSARSALVQRLKKLNPAF